MGLVSVREAAKELGCSTEHLRRMFKSGKLPSYFLGPKARRVDVDEIKKLGRLISESRKETDKLK